MKRKTLCVFLATQVAAAGLLYLLSRSAQADGPSVIGEGGNDKICQSLFRDYIVQGARIADDDLCAAYHLIASRGRFHGFWREVLAELRKDKKNTEMACVRILGKMLETDAAVREIIRLRKEGRIESPLIDWPRLDKNVLVELISRAKRKDPSQVRQYVIAIARSRDASAKDFLLEVLQSEPAGGLGMTEQFHAAVGLSQIAEPAGVDWLVANCQEGRRGMQYVFNAWPERVIDRHLSSCCAAALKALTGESGQETSEDWRAWWGSARADFVPSGRVRIVEGL